MRNAREMRISFRVELQGRLTPSVDDSPNHHGLLLLVYPVKVDGRAEIDRALPIVDLHREWAVVIRAIMIEDSLCLLHGLCCCRLEGHLFRSGPRLVSGQWHKRAGTSLCT